MIGLLALMAAGALEAPPPPPTAEEEKEILVIGRKAVWWRGNWASKDDAVTCTTQVSTGDVAVDTILCDGLKTCAPKYVPEMEAEARARQASKQPLTRQELPAFMKPYTAKIMKCGRQASKPAYLALIRKRKAAR